MNEKITCRVENNGQTYVFHFPNDGHTIGHMLQKELEDDARVKFAGYRMKETVEVCGFHLVVIFREDVVSANDIPAARALVKQAALQKLCTKYQLIRQRSHQL